MKWFKHMANARDDDFMEWLEEEYGFEGVGRWWRILEIIASAMEKNANDPSTTHTWTKWQTLLRGKRSVLNGYLTAIASRGKMFLEQNENILKINVPNLLKLRDEYSKKSRHTPDTRQSDFLQEAEAEANTYKDLKATPLPPAIVDNSKVKKESFKNNDFDAAAVACCCVLNRKVLSPTDAALLLGWLEKYDWEKYLKPLLISKTEKFAESNMGKRPASLQYFTEAIREKAP